MSEPSVNSEENKSEKDTKKENKQLGDGEDKSSSEPKVEELLDNMPPKIRSTFMALMQSSTRSISSHPLFDKFDEKHIHKFLDYLQEDDNNRFKLKSSSRYFTLIYVCLVIAVIVFLVVYLLPANKELLVDILKTAVGFFAGVGSGFGLKSHLDKKK